MICTICVLLVCTQFKSVQYSNTMSIIYSRDTDDDYSTPNDTELYHLIWNGSSWRSPTRLTNDSQPDNNPRLFYTATGQPQLLWMKDDGLYGLIGDLNGSPEEISAEGSASMMAYDVAQTLSDNLALLWQDYSDQGVDVFYTVYNAQKNGFSDTRQLTQDEPLEAFMAPTFAPNGELVMAYNKTQLLTETIQVSPTLTISNVTTLSGKPFS